MATAFALLCMLALPGRGMGTNWPLWRNTAGNAGSSPETIVLPLTLRWHSDAPHIEENGVIVANGVAYISTVDGFLHAFAVATGFEVSGFPIVTGGSFGTPAVDVANGRIYALVSPGTLYAFNLNGTPAWSAQVGGIGGNYTQGPSVDGGFVYVVAGSQLSKYNAGGTLQWSSPSGVNNNDQPAVMNGYVYLNAFGQIKKFDKTTGAEITTSGFPIATASENASLTAVNDALFFKADQLYAYSAVDGHLLWAQAAGGDSAYTGSPAVAGGFVYAYGLDGRVYAFDVATGTPAAGFPTVALNTPGARNYSSPSVAGDKIFIGAGITQELKVVGAAGSASAGAVLDHYLTFSTDQQGFDLCSPAVSDGYVFAMLDGGGLYAFQSALGTPTGVATINGGATCTESPNVTLSLDNGGNAAISQMIISEDPFFSGAAYEPFAPTKPWTFSGGNGKKTLYVKFKDTQGTESNVFSASIDWLETCLLIALAPTTAENPVGTQHTVTATITNASAAPQAGVQVTFAVVSGPNADTNGTCSANANCTTDTNGQVSFTYTDASGPGTDAIRGCFPKQGGGQTCSQAVMKTWVEGGSSTTTTTTTTTSTSTTTTTMLTCNGCDDGNPCTTDACNPTAQDADANGCTHRPVICVALDACHAAGVCNAETGLCTNPPLDGTPCDDGNRCTRTDVCRAGTCVGTNPVTCTAADVCHVAGTCDPLTGCSNPNAPDGTTCADSNVCNGQEICQAGTCAAPSVAAALACENRALVAFVTDFSDNAVAFLPTAATSVAGNAAVGTSPWGLAIRPFTNEIFTTNRASASVTIINSSSRATLGTISVGATPLGIAMNPAGTRAWVANYDANSLSIIDAASRAVMGTIPVGKGPAGLRLNAGGTRLYVSNYAAGTVSVVDTASSAVIGTVAVGAQPLELGVDEVKRRLYVANYGSDTVTVIGTLSNSVITTVAVGSKPFGVAVDSAASRAYITNASSDVVSVIDTGLNTVLGTIPVGRAPFGIDLDRTGKRAFVANAGGNTVSVIDTASRAVTATVPVGNLPIAFGDFLGVITSECGAPSLGTCNDGDPFTVDTCSPNTGCQHASRGSQGDLAAGLAELASDVQGSNLADLGGSNKLKNLLQQLVNSALAQVGTPSAVARDLLTPLDHPSPRATGATRKRLKRINKALKQFIKAVEKGIRKKTIQRDFGWKLLDVARASQNSVASALGKPAAVGRPSAAVVSRNPPLPL